MCRICDAEENDNSDDDDVESVKSLKRNDVPQRHNIKKTTKKKMQSFLSFPHHDTKNLPNCA